MKDSPPKISKREARVAAALRANLLRRKQQARARQKNSPSAPNIIRADKKKT